MPRRRLPGRRRGAFARRRGRAAAARLEDGYLRKRGRMNPAWKTRWCEAWPDEGRLYYFREYNENGAAATSVRALQSAKSG